MTTNKLRDWLEIVGLFGVIASLVFVGLQLKQDREIAIASTYQDRTAMAVEAFHALAQNETALRTIAKSTFGDPDLTTQPDGFAAPVTVFELSTVSMAGNALAMLADNSFYQYQAGFLPEDHWLVVRETVKNAMATIPVYRLVFAGQQNSRSPEFNLEILEILAEIDAEKGIDADTPKP